MIEASERQPILSVQGVRVEYPGVRALDGASFELRPGEVHALLGENGAGKSTLIRVLSGLVVPSAGTMMLGGRPFGPHSPREAESAGVSVVHQELDLIPTMTVADNLALGRGGSWSWVRPRRRDAMAREALARVGLRLDVGATLAELSTAYQQLVAIARALAVRARVLVLDEPTSSLDAGETAGLLQVVRELAGQGLGVVFVTHFLDQVDAVSDRITGDVATLGVAVRQMSEEVSTGRFLLGVRRLQQELVDTFRGEAAEAAVDRTADLGFLIRQNHLFQSMSQQGLSAMLDQMESFRTGCQGLKTLSLGLEVIRVMAKLTTATLPSPATGLSGLMEDLGHFQAGIAGRLDRIQSLNRAMLRDGEQVVQDLRAAA